MPQWFGLGGKETGSHLPLPRLTKLSGKKKAEGVLECPRAQYLID